MIKVDKNFPLPKLNKQYPFDEMEVGDSFFLPKGKVSSARSMACRRFGPGAVTTRTVTEDGVEGVRVWRVK